MIAYFRSHSWGALSNIREVVACEKKVGSHFVLGKVKSFILTQLK